MKKILGWLVSFHKNKVVFCKLDCPQLPVSKIYVTYRSTMLMTANVLDDTVAKLSLVIDMNALDAATLTTLVSRYKCLL